MVQSVQKGKLWNEIKLTHKESHTHTQPLRELIYISRQETIKKKLTRRNWNQQDGETDTTKYYLSVKSNMIS